MQPSLQRTIGKHAVHLSRSLYPKLSAATTQITPARTCLHADAHQARAEELVDPSKPIEGPLLEEPQEPGPEDCCQVWPVVKSMQARYLRVNSPCTLSLQKTANHLFQRITVSSVWFVCRAGALCACGICTGTTCMSTGCNKL